MINSKQALESFIIMCDDLMIPAEEGFFSDIKDKIIKLKKKSNLNKNRSDVNDAPLVNPSKFTQSKSSMIALSHKGYTVIVKNPPNKQENQAKSYGMSVVEYFIDNKSAIDSTLKEVLSQMGSDYSEFSILCITADYTHQEIITLMYKNNGTTLEGAPIAVYIHENGKFRLDVLYD